MAQECALNLQHQLVQTSWTAYKSVHVYRFVKRVPTVLRNCSPRGLRLCVFRISGHPKAIWSDMTRGANVTSQLGGTTSIFRHGDRVEAWWWIKSVVMSALSKSSTESTASMCLCWGCVKISVPCNHRFFSSHLCWLVVSNMFYFSIIYGMSSFPLTFTFCKMVIAPPTSYSISNACFWDPSWSVASW